MEMGGIDVMAVPTALFSNRPRYPTIRGQVLDAGLVADLLMGLEERGAVDTCQVILTGYLGSPQIGESFALHHRVQAPWTRPDENEIDKDEAKERREFAVVQDRIESFRCTHQEI